MLLAVLLIFLQGLASAVSLREHLLASLSAHASANETSEYEFGHDLFPSCLVHPASRECPSEYALASFGFDVSVCCQTGPLSGASTSGEARVLFGSGENNGINSTGVITHAMPHFNTTTLEITLTYALLANQSTTACNRLDVLLESRDRLVPEIHCIKHDEYITGIWMFTKENLASLRFSVTCCQLE